MTIEKAFAIDAAPEVIWDALWRELSAGEPDSFSIVNSQWPGSFTVRLVLGGMPVELTYKIIARSGSSEVSATLEPLSFRYKLFQVVSFGHVRRNYEMLLVQGLANLKEAVEMPAEGALEPEPE